MIAALKHITDIATDTVEQNLTAVVTPVVTARQHVKLDAGAYHRAWLPAGGRSLQGRGSLRGSPAGQRG